MAKLRNKVCFPENVTVEIDTMTFSWRAGPAPGNPEQAVVTIPLPPKPADVTAEELTRWASKDNKERPRYLGSCC